MPRNVDIVPLDDTDSRHQGYDGSYENHHFSRNAMQALCNPHHEYTDKYGYGLEFLSGHLAHCIEFLTEAFHTALDLWLPLLRLEREYHLHADEPSDEEQDHRERECGSEPVSIKHCD